MLGQPGQIASKLDPGSLHRATDRSGVVQAEPGNDRGAGRGRTGRTGRTAAALEPKPHVILPSIAPQQQGPGGTEHGGQLFGAPGHANRLDLHPGRHGHGSASCGLVVAVTVAVAVAATPKTARG